MPIRLLPTLSLVASLTVVSCGGDVPSGPPGGGGGPPPPRGEVHAVFVGNSLTYVNDLPGFVRTIAEVAGESFTYATVTFPGVSLEDHWNGGGAVDAIRRERPDVVVMQQGPSSLAAHQLHLREWAGRFAEVAREEGGEPGLYMVWPESARPEAFDAVSQSYADAAEAVDGYLFPAGEAWRAVWRMDPDIGLYGPDGFHPSRTGTAVAALTIFRVLFRRPVTELPPELVPDTPGLPAITFTPDQAAVLYQGVEEAVDRFGRR